MTKAAAAPAPSVAQRPETYGEWLRRQPIETLSSDEVERLLWERAWDEQHTHEARRLDAFVGQLVRLRRTMETWFSECGPAESATARDVGYATRKVPRGTRFYVRARWGPRLLGLDRVSGEAYLLRGDWMELAPDGSE